MVGVAKRDKRYAGPGGDPAFKLPQGRSSGAVRCAWSGASPSSRPLSGEIVEAQLGVVGNAGKPGDAVRVEPAGDRAAAATDLQHQPRRAGAELDERVDRTVPGNQRLVEVGDVWT